MPVMSADRMTEENMPECFTKSVSRQAYSETSTTLAKPPSSIRNPTVMFRRYAALAPWTRRLIALAIGLLIGMGVTTAYLNHQYAAIRGLAVEYADAHKAGDVERLAALFCWEGVPAAERARIKLVLKQELDLPLKEIRPARLGPDDGKPRETLEGRRVPNLKPEFRLNASFGDAQGAGITGWLVGKTDAGYKIVVFRPENAPGN